MTKEQAIVYLRFSGFSEEQIKAIEGAFTCDKCVYSTSEGCQYDDITETIPPFDDCISRQAVLDLVNADWKYEGLEEPINSLPPVSSSEKSNKWIPIKTRPLTNKEKEEYADLGYSEDSIDSMYDCPLPNDGEEVLITTRYDEVTTDTFYRDEGCYFEIYCDKDDVKAWMSKPIPYKAEGSGE